MLVLCSLYFCFFFFNDTATTEIYTLSLHDALPIWPLTSRSCRSPTPRPSSSFRPRSEEHTSELQSLRHLVCRLLLEKKKNITMRTAAAPVSPRGPCFETPEPVQ